MLPTYFQSMMNIDPVYRNNVVMRPPYVKNNNTGYTGGAQMDTFGQPSTTALGQSSYSFGKELSLSDKEKAYREAEMDPDSYSKYGVAKSDAQFTDASSLQGQYDQKLEYEGQEAANAVVDTAVANSDSSGFDLGELAANPWVSAGLAVGGTALGAFNALDERDAARKRNKELSSMQTDLRRNINRSFGNDAEAQNMARGNTNTTRLMAAMERNPQNSMMYGQMYGADLSSMHRSLDTNREARAMDRRQIADLEKMKTPLGNPWITGVLGGVRGTGTGMSWGKDLSNLASFYNQWNTVKQG